LCPLFDTCSAWLVSSVWSSGGQ